MSALNSNNTFDGLDEPVRPTPGGRKRRLDCHNEDGRIQLRKESLLQEVIHSEKLNGAFRRAEAELP